MWESTTGKMLRVLKGHKGGVFGLTKMGRNAFLSCSGDQTIKVIKDVLPPPHNNLFNRNGIYIKKYAQICGMSTVIE